MGSLRNCFSANDIEILQVSCVEEPENLMSRVLSSVCDNLIPAEAGLECMAGKRQKVKLEVVEGVLQGH